MSTAAIVGGTIAGGVIGAVGSNAAAGKQAQGAQQAAQLQSQQSQAALDWQKQQFGIQQQELAPWLQTGTNAINRLNSLMGLGSNQPAGGIQPASAAGFGGFGGGGPNIGRLAALGGDGMNPMSLRGLSSMNGGLGPDANMGRLPSDIFNPGQTVSMNGQPATATTASAPAGAATPGAIPGTGQDTPFSDWNQTFQAPTNVTEQNDPGYQFRLQQGQQALENSAAARGGLLSGGTGKALEQFGQDYASNEYGNVYNRALGQYQQNYNIFQNNQNTKFNRLAALSGIGQTSAAQLGSLGQQGANNAGNIFLTSGQQIGNDYQNAAAARASGYAGATNAITGGISNLSQLYLLSQLGGLGGLIH